MENDIDNEEVGSSKIIAEPLTVALGDRYLKYALATITDRALPDSRDGLKPVHRRILFAMRGLKLDPTSAFRKCAKIVGEVMGNYHPHGDKAIYDALARLAQDFNIRYPLIEGQGNFGNIDGDNPAAQRYTEARLTKVSKAMLDGLNEDSVAFKENYDGSEDEPEVLPGAFPQLLANGSYGIAVGMATNIPPHNVHEICEAALYLINEPNANVETLLEILPGPDFPTGGIIVEPKENILDAYRTGKGSIRLRARYCVENLKRGQWQIIITEIPYQVQKSKLIEKIADLINLKKIPMLLDIRDESAEDIRLVLEPRTKSIDPMVLMESLYKKTELETRISLNMNVLINGRIPVVSGLDELLKEFINHSRDVIVRRSLFRLKKIDLRLEVLEGYIVAYLNLDRVIQIIRNEDEPKKNLIKEFDLTDIQADSILDMRLRSLRKLEEMELRSERDQLQIERVTVEDLISSEKLQWAKVTEQIMDLKKIFGYSSDGGARRTDYDKLPDIQYETLENDVEKEPMTVVCSKLGWIRTIKGHINSETVLRYRDGDEAEYITHTYSTEKLLLLGSNGRAYTLQVSNLPGGRSLGEPLRIIIDLPNEFSIKTLLVYAPGERLIVASDSGNGFIVKAKDLLAQTKSGKQFMNLKLGTTLLTVTLVKGDHVATVGNNRKILIFPVADLPEMSRGKGVRLQKFKEAKLTDLFCFNLEDGLTWSDPSGRKRVENDLQNWLGRRASAGRMAPRGFPKDNKFS